MDEKVFFEHGSVQVTNARFKVDAQTYAIRNITSTAVWTKPQKWLGVALCVLIAIGSLTGNAIGVGVFFLLLAGGLYWLGRPMHFVKLSTASGEVKALQSREKHYVLHVVNALNDAMVSQSRSAT